MCLGAHISYSHDHHQATLQTEEVEVTSLEFQNHNIRCISRMIIYATVFDNRLASKLYKGIYPRKYEYISEEMIMKSP